MENNQERIFLGKTTATQITPNTVYEFYFWIKDDVIVQPYDFVTAIENDYYTIGEVLDISTYTDAQSHLTNRISSDLESADIQRLHAKIARANVFYSFIKKKNGEIEERVQPVSSGVDVYVSTEEEILKGLNAGREIEKKIPGGFIVRSIGEPVMVSFDEDYLLGPQSAHMNISGISGLATKTSYMMFLLNVIDKLKPAEYIKIIFNVKQAELMNLDKNADNLTKLDIEMYKKVFVNDTDLKPFNNVKYYVPRRENGYPKTYSKRQDIIKYAFALADVYSDLDLLFAGIPDPWGTAASFAHYAQRDWDRKNSSWIITLEKGRVTSDCRRIDLSTWSKLSGALSLCSEVIAQYYGFQQSTVGRIMRIINQLTSSGLFVDNRSQNEVFIREVVRNAKPGENIVIDIAKLSQAEQAFVVGEVFRELDEIINTEQEGSKKKAIVVVDELNSLAPKGADTPLKQQIIEVARKGRSAHFIIFGAEQFASEVDDQIVGNSALRVIGRTSAVELQSPAFKILSQSEKNSAMILRKGELIVSFPTLRTNIKIKFPNPLYQTPI